MLINGKELFETVTSISDRDLADVWHLWIQAAKDDFIRVQDGKCATSKDEIQTIEQDHQHLIFKERKRDRDLLLDMPVPGTDGTVKLYWHVFLKCTKAAVQETMRLVEHRFKRVVKDIKDPEEYKRSRQAVIFNTLTKTFDILNDSKFLMTESGYVLPYARLYVLARTDVPFSTTATLQDPFIQIDLKDWQNKHSWQASISVGTARKQIQFSDGTTGMEQYLDRHPHWCDAPDLHINILDLYHMDHTSQAAAAGPGLWKRDILQKSMESALHDQKDSTPFIDPQKKALPENGILFLDLDKTTPVIRGRLLEGHGERFQIRFEKNRGPVITYHIDLDIWVKADRKQVNDVHIPKFSDFLHDLSHSVSPAKDAGIIPLFDLKKTKILGDLDKKDLLGMSIKTLSDRLIMTQTLYMEQFLASDRGPDFKNILDLLMEESVDNDLANVWKKACRQIFGVIPHEGKTLYQKVDMSKDQYHALMNATVEFVDLYRKLKPIKLDENHPEFDCSWNYHKLSESYLWPGKVCRKTLETVYGLTEESRHRFSDLDLKTYTKLLDTVLTYLKQTLLYKSCGKSGILDQLEDGLDRYHDLKDFQKALTTIIESTDRLYDRLGDLDIGYGNSRVFIDTLDVLDERYRDYLRIRNLILQTGHMTSEAIPIVPTNGRRKLENCIETEHNRILEIYDNLQTKISNEVFSRSVDKVRHLEYEENDFMIKTPKTADDLTTEGKILHHCVGSYRKAVSEGRTNILFLRKTTEPEKPYITIEVQDDTIQQIHGKYNQTPCSTSREMSFVSRWCENKDLHLGRYDQVR